MPAGLRFAGVFMSLELASSFHRRRARQVCTWLRDLDIQTLLNCSLRLAQTWRRLTKCVAREHCQRALRRHGLLRLPPQLGYTPLHYAAAFGNLEATRAIVQYGADVQAVSAEGSSALDLASEGRQAAVAQFLAAAGSTRSATARLKDWLHAIRLGGYFNAFLAQGFDDVDFIATSGLTQADLDAVGVTLAGHRSKLLQVYRISEFTSGSAAAGAGEGSDSEDGSDSDSDSGSGSDSGSDTDESE